MQKDTSSNHSKTLALRMRQCIVPFLALSFFLLFFLLSSEISRGQKQEPSPIIIVSWKSPTFVPSGYFGKALPVYDSRVSVSADLFFGSSFVDPDLLFYTWSLNGSRFATGKGLRKTSFVVKSGPRTGYFVRVKIDFLGREVEKSFSIPTSEPRVIITQQRPHNILKEGTNLFVARPFFFSAQNASFLSFDWLFNGTPVSKASVPPEKFILEILPQTPPNTSASVGIGVRNAASALELASQNISLVVQ